MMRSSDCALSELVLMMLLRMFSFQMMIEKLIKKKKKKQKQKRRKEKKKLTTEHVSFGLQTTPEIETEVLRHQTVRGKY